MPAHDVIRAESMMILRYDADCSLCRDLAALVASRSRGSLTLEPLPEQARSIEFFDGAAWHVDTEAWKMLLLHLPDLKSLGWLAQKLHLETVVAKSVASMASGVKWFCKHCGRRV